MQTKLDSFFESLLNVVVGYLIALGSQLLVFPLFGINIPLADNILIGMIFTVVSIARSYLIRRWRNKKVSCPNCGFCR